MVQDDKFVRQSIDRRQSERRNIADGVYDGTERRKRERRTVTRRKSD